MIPRIFHRVWPGDDEIPDQFATLWKTWQSHHPTWEFVTWRPADYLPLINQKSYDQATSLAQRADIVRYEILNAHGGVYVDTDFECFKPLDELIEGLHGFIAKEDDTFVCISIMGVAPRHPLTDQLIAMVPHSISSQPGAPANVQTGPHLASKVIAEGSAIFVPPLLRIFPASYFYPYRYDEVYLRDEDFPDAYAAHHWAGSWLDTDVPQREPDPVRILVEVDLSARPSPDAVLSRFGELFVTGEPAEIAVPLGAARPEGILRQLADFLRVSGVEATRAANIVLYTDNELPNLRVSARWRLGSIDPVQRDKATAALERQRRVVDAYRRLCKAQSHRQILPAEMS